LGAQHPTGGRTALFDHVPLDGVLTMHLVEIPLPLVDSSKKI
jgi:hypothetical protein